MLLVIAVVLITVVFVVPITFGPAVEPPTDLQFGNPSGVEIRVSNQNLTPLSDVQYTCELSKLILASGADIKDATVLVRGAVRKMAGRRAINVRCEAAYLVTDPLKAVEYQLKIVYRPYPWPRQRSGVYQIAADINASGQITGWKLK